MKETRLIKEEKEYTYSLIEIKCKNNYILIPDSCNEKISIPEERNEAK